MEADYKAFVADLITKPPLELLEGANENSVKDDILYYLGNNKLSEYKRECMSLPCQVLKMDFHSQITSICLAMHRTAKRSTHLIRGR